MVSVFNSSAVDRDFDPYSGRNKDYKIVLYVFSANLQKERRSMDSEQI